MRFARPLLLYWLAIAGGTAAAQVTAPELITSYIVNPNGNQLPVNDGEIIRFTSATPGQTSTVTFIILNRGTAPGALQRAVVAGNAFRISGLPLLPTPIAPDREIRFTLSFAPSAREHSQGSLVIQLSNSTKTIRLEGDGIAPEFSYEYVAESGAQPLAPGGTIRFHDTAVGGAQTLLVRVRNDGTSPGPIRAIVVSGATFQVSDLPALPATLEPGQSVQFVLNFRPADPGSFAGTLRIDSVSMAVAATGLGPKLAYSARVGQSVSRLQPNAVISLPNTPVGSTSSVELRIENSGNLSASVNSIALTGSAFKLADLPSLPLAVGPGEAASIAITLSPDAIGALGGALQIDDVRFSLRATGEPPPSLPRVQFTLVGDTAEPFQQPAVALSLETPYNLDLSGKLVVGFTSEGFADDPSIQFATGGRSVDFRIPLGSTEAIFGEGARQVLFQTGTVAGAISISASFSVGGVNLTPNPAPLKTLAVTAAPPQLRSAQIVPRSASSFDLIVTGYSTARSVSEINLRFTAAAGQNLQTTSLTPSVESAFISWYQSPTSRQFGSQFSATINVLVNGDINALQSVSVTAANSRGTSTPVSANFR